MTTEIKPHLKIKSQQALTPRLDRPAPLGGALVLEPNKILCRTLYVTNDVNDTNILSLSAFAGY